VSKIIYAGILLAIAGAAYSGYSAYERYENFKSKSQDLMVESAKKITAPLSRLDSCKGKIVIDNVSFEPDGFLKKTGSGRVFVSLGGQIIVLPYKTEVVGQKIYANVVDPEKVQGEMLPFAFKGCGA